MDKKLTFTGGEPNINFDDILRDPIANRAALFAVLKAFNVGANENFIISGCVPTVSTGVDVDVTAGYIFLNEEILEVEAQTVVDGGTLDLYKYVKSTTYDAAGDKTFNDSTARQTWQKNRGIVTAATSPIIGTELDVVDGDTLLDKVNGGRIFLNMNLGDWNMDANGALIIAHGLSDHKKIRRVTVTIRDDADSGYHPLDTAATIDVVGSLSGGVRGWDATNVTLERLTGGWFDNANFDSTSYNRGFLTIEYLP